jgi:P4 family phage/plasmid primase-like protien
MIKKANQPSIELLSRLGFRFYSCKRHVPNDPSSKHPEMSGYKRGDLEPEQAASQMDERSVGALIPDDMIVIDVDVATKERPEKVGAESFDKLKKDFPEFNELETLRQDSPSGGQHFFFKVPPESRDDLAGKTDDYPDIDILKEQVCIGKHWQGGQYVLDTTHPVAELPARLLEHLTKKRIAPPSRTLQPNTEWEIWKEEARSRVPLERVFDLTGDSAGGGWYEARDPASQTGDRNPSCGVADGSGEAKRGTFHSFITQETVDLFAYVQRHHGAADFKAATELVAEWSGVPLPRSREAGNGFEAIAGEPKQLSKARPEEVATEFLDKCGSHYEFIGEEIYKFNGHCYTTVSEKSVQNALLNWLEEAGYTHLHRNPVAGVMQNIKKRDKCWTHRIYWRCVGVAQTYGVAAERLIPTTKGLVNMEDGNLMSPHFELFTTKAIVLDNKDPSCKRWEKFLKETYKTQEEITELQKFFGYCLTDGTKYHTFLYICGPAGSGKGVTADVLRGITKSCSFKLSRLGVQYSLQGFVGCQLACDDDVRGFNNCDALGELLKITGGDMLEITRKYREPVSQHLPTKILLCGNELLNFKDNTDALKRRLLLLRAPNQVAARDRDPDLKADLAKERYGILLWALEGLKMLEADKRFIQPSAGKELVKEQEYSTSPMKQFIDEHCVLGPEHSVPVQGLYTQYTTWQRSNGYRVVSSSTFGKELREVCPVVKKSAMADGKKKNAYYGIDIRTNAGDF